MEDLLFFVHLYFFFRDVCRDAGFANYISLYNIHHRKQHVFLLRRQMPGEGRESGIAERCLCLFDLYRVM